MEGQKTRHGALGLGCRRFRLESKIGRLSHWAAQKLLLVLRPEPTAGLRDE